MLSLSSGLMWDADAKSLIIYQGKTLGLKDKAASRSILRLRPWLSGGNLLGMGLRPAAGERGMRDALELSAWLDEASDLLGMRRPPVVGCGAAKGWADKNGVALGQVVFEGGSGWREVVAHELAHAAQFRNGLASTALCMDSPAGRAGRNGTSADKSRNGLPLPPRRPPLASHCTRWATPTPTRPTARRCTPPSKGTAWTRTGPASPESSKSEFWKWSRRRLDIV